MSDGPAHSEKEPKQQVPAGISAALRYSEGGHGAAGTQDRRERPYVSRGIEGPKVEPERPAEPVRSAAASLYRANEAAHDPKAPAEGFVGPTSFGASVLGGAPLQARDKGGDPGDPNRVPAGGPVSWAKRSGAQAAEVGPPPAHPLSVASPLGLGVAGGAWSAPEQAGARVRELAAPAGNLSPRASSSLAGGPEISSSQGGSGALGAEAGNLHRGAGATLRGAGASRGASGGSSPAAAITSAWRGVFAA